MTDKENTMVAAPQVILAPEPFTPTVEVLEVPALGQKVSDLIAAAIRQGKLKPDADTIRRIMVHVNGVPLPAETPEQRRAAMQYVPKPGEVVNLVVTVHGGGGGGGDKVLKTVLTIAVIALSMYVGGGAATPGLLDAAWIRAAGSAAVMVGGQMLINSMSDGPETMASSNDPGALKDGSNRYRPRSPMPLCLGRRHWQFDLAAPPYTTTIGQDVWLTLAVAPHYGRCWVGNIKLGETLLSDYPAADYQIEYFLDPGVPRRSTLYPNSVAQENFQDKLDFAGGGVWDVHTALKECDRLEVDIELPSGLRFNSPSSGKVRNEEVAGQIEFAEVGTENWQPATFPGYNTARDKNNNLLPAGSFYLNMKTPDPIRRTFGWEVPDPAKLYKVRVKAYDRDGDYPDGGERTWATVWTALRAVTNQPPILDENLAVIFIRVKSTDDLNGNLPVISGEVEPIIPVYKSGNWDTEERSSNGAALLRWLLTGPAAAVPMQPSEFHSSLETTYNLIEANPTWKGALLVTEDKSQQDVMVGLGKMGRFSTFYNGSKLCFVPDWSRGAPRQVFSGRNAGGYRYRRTFPEPIHAVFIEFENTEEGTLEDELYVYADGYDASNATLIETLRLDFATTQARAYQEGRVYLAKRLLQVEMHEWTAGIDAIATTYGDRVLVSHPSTLYGLASGRVVNRLFQGSLVEGFRLDEDVEMAAGTSYGVDIRRHDGTTLRGIPVITEPGRTNVLKFAAPRTAEASPKRGDLVIFGEIGQITEDLEIIDVEPQDDMTVQFRAIPYIPNAIQEAIEGPIPEIPSKIKPRNRAPKPNIARPDFVDPLVGTSLKATVEGWDGTPIASFNARWRTTVVDLVEGPLTTPWQTLAPVPAREGIIRTGPIQGAANAPTDGQQVQVDVEVRTVLKNGEFSDAVVIAAIPVLAPIPAPDGFAAAGLQRVRSDGSSFGAIEVHANPISVGNITTLEIEVRKDDGSTWKTPTGGLIAARLAQTDVLGLDVGEPGYFVRARWIRSDNWPGPWAETEDPVVIPAFSDVSSDTVFVAGYPASELLVDLQSAFDMAQTALDTVEAIEGDFDAVFEAAEEAASSAILAADAAAQAAIAANTAEDHAESASSSAIGAAASQEGANTSALAAASSASTAAAWASDAEDHASAAEADRLLAQTARSQAQTSATDAANARDAAGVSEANAASSALLAANSRDQASGFANAASGSASTASTKADEAGLSAAAAMASQVSASTASDAALGAAIATIPDTVTADLWTISSSLGAPTSRSNLPASYVINGAYKPPSDLYVLAGPKAFLPWQTGRIYELTMTVVGGGADAYARFVVERRDAAYATRLSGAGASSPVAVPIGQTVTITRRFGLGVAVSGGSNLAQLDAAWVGFAVHVNTASNAASTVAGASQTVTSFTIRDVTTQVASETAASASATSASSASASETAAGQSATAASGSATNASTSAGQALTYRNEASSAKDDAISASVFAGTSAQFALGGALATFPPVVAVEYWTLASSPGAPAERPNIGASTVSNGRYVGTALCGPKQRLQWLDQRVVEVSAEVHNPNSTPSQFAFAAFRFTEGLTYLTWNTVGPIGTIGAGETVTYTIRFVMGSGVPGAANFARNDAAWVSLAVRNNLVSGNSPVQVGPIAVRDVTSEAASAGHAATALTQASNASASAASAEISANLAASVGSGSVNSNPAFSNYPGTSVPAGWSNWNSANGTNERVEGVNGGYAIQSTYGGSGFFGVSQTSIPAAPEGMYAVLEVDVQRRSGTFVGSAIEVQARNSSNSIVKSSGNINVRNTIGTPGTIGAIYQIRKLIDLRGSAITQYQIYLKTRGLTGETEPVVLRWERAVLRAATEQEIAAGTVLPALEAQLNITAATTADLETRMATARFEVTAASGGNPAQLKIRADATSSLAALVAQAVSFSNTISGAVVEVMRLIGGDVYITGKLFMGLAKQITLDPTIPALIFTPTTGTAKMIYGSGFGANSDCIMWFGPKDTVVGDITRTNGSWSFGTDRKVYYGLGELGGGGMTAKVSRTFVVGSRSGAGSVTTPTTSILVSGTSEAVTYRWWYISGDTSIVKGGPSASEANWQTTLTAMQSKSATWGWSATTASGSQSGIVEIVAQAF